VPDNEARLSDTGIYRAISEGTARVLEEHLAPMERKMGVHKDAIYGVENKPETGLLYRMLSQEKIAKYLLWIAAVAVSAGAVAIVTNIVNWVMAKGS